MIKKHLIALFVDTSDSSTPAFKRIKKSTELTIAMNAETEDYDYIADEYPTTEIEKYKPSIEQPLKMIAGEDDFEYFFEFFRDMKVGDDAKTKAMVVFLFDNQGTDQSPAYGAWLTTATITMNEMNGNDSELNFQIGFGGDTKVGTATVTGTAPDYVPTFTEGQG